MSILSPGLGRAPRAFDLRLLPVVLATVARPHGHDFAVTPKGSDAEESPGRDLPTVFMATELILLTSEGLVLNARTGWDIAGSGASIPVVVF